MAAASGAAIRRLTRDVRRVGADLLIRAGTALRADRPEPQQLPPTDEKIAAAFVERLRGDEAATSGFVRSVVVACLHYGNTHDAGVLRRLARDVAATVELHADQRYTSRQHRPKTAERGRSVEEMFESLSKR